MPGPKRTPTNILKLQNTSAARVKEREATEPDVALFDEAPLPPPYLSDEAKEFWLEIVPALHSAKILAQSDIPALGTYCEAYSQWRKATDRVNKTGLVIIGSDGIPRINPYFTVAEKCARQMQRLWGEFGMTPASRSKIAVDKKLAQEDDPWSKFVPVQSLRSFQKAHDA